MAICCPAEFVDGAVAIQMARHVYLREAAWYKQRIILRVVSPVIRRNRRVISRGMNVGDHGSGGEVEAK